MQFCHITANCWIRVLGKIHFSTAMSHAKCSWHHHLRPCDSSIPFHLRPVKLELGPLTPKPPPLQLRSNQVIDQWWLLLTLGCLNINKKLNQTSIDHGQVVSQVLVDVNLQWKIILGELLLFLLPAEGNWKILCVVSLTEDEDGDWYNSYDDW